jgi:outer membrane receptor for ferrienterochelin and colicins
VFGFSRTNVIIIVMHRFLTLLIGVVALIVVQSDAAALGPAGLAARSPRRTVEQSSGTLVVRVISRSGPVEAAEVRAGDVIIAHTDAKGEAVLTLPPGPADLVVSRAGFEPATVRALVKEGARITLPVELEIESEATDEVIVTATRTEQRIQDLPLRVEVVPQEEIEEKVFMTPGDVSMMLTETNGLRVQVTSPSLGAANVRVQGLRGRYAQILSDGLPLYGGSVGLLQIPPMDLAQVEIIKGVASALYGPSALGGVINLVSRRPQKNRPERELLVNRTTRGGTDTVLWLSNRPSDRWGYTLLGGGHWQERTDVDRDGWTDLAGYQRATVRPRLTWENGAGRSVFLTIGALGENRSGGTLGGATAPDGKSFREAVSTRRLDAGLVGRFVTGGGRLLTVRTSGLGQWHDHQFGEARERDFHHTWFAETAFNGKDGAHTWVLGGALQRDLYRSRALPEFDYTYTVPGIFVQDDYAPRPWLTISASGRVDVHDEFGTFFSPRISTLVKPGHGWTLRLSTGAGIFAPTPFTEETEATGLSRLAPLGDLEAERGRSLSADASWKHGPLETTVTFFRSNVSRAAALRDLTAPVGGKTVELVNVAGDMRTIGSELIGRFHRGQMDLIVTHMFIWSVEPDPDSGMRREVPFNPRHTAGLDWLWAVEGRARIGFEMFYTGRQRLDDSPYRELSEPYLLWGLVGDWHLGRARVFANVENLSNFRQTQFDPLVRPSRAVDGRWTVDGWGPLEGRIFNAGVRFRF